MSNEINVLIESPNGDKLNDSILRLAEQERVESGASKQFDRGNWSIELLGSSKLFCRIAEKPGFINFLKETAKLQGNLTMKYWTLSEEPEPPVIYWNKDGEWWTTVDNEGVEAASKVKGESNGEVQAK
jgi:hypothetical protein